MESIDINCDMGESFGNWIMGDDSGMMERVTTANVACGFHASDPLTMLETVSLAKKKKTNCKWVQDKNGVVRPSVR